MCVVAGYVSDFFELNLLTMKWTSLNSLFASDAPKYRAFLRLQVVSDTVYIFGGKSMDGEFPGP